MASPLTDTRDPEPQPSALPQAIVRLSSHRTDLLVFEIHGRLHAADMRWMAEHVADAYAQEGRIDILLLFRAFDGATAGAIFEPKALKEEAAAIAHVRRYGVVGAPGWVDAMIGLGDGVSPVDAATFSDEAEARAWIDRS